MNRDERPTSDAIQVPPPVHLAVPANQAVTNGLLPSSQSAPISSVAVSSQAPVTAHNGMPIDEDESVEEAEDSGSHTTLSPSSSGTAPAGEVAESMQHWLLTTALGAIQRHSPAYPIDYATVRDITADGEHGFPTEMFQDLYFRDEIRDMTPVVSRQYKQLYSSVLAGLKTLLALQEDMEKIPRGDVSSMHKYDEEDVVDACVNALTASGKRLLEIDEKIRCLHPFYGGERAAAVAEDGQPLEDEGAE